MSEQSDILFMQVRLIRLASEEWHLQIEKVLEIFKKANILDYQNRRKAPCFSNGDIRRHTPSVR